MTDVLKITGTSAAEDLMTPGTVLTTILTDMRSRCAEASQQPAPAPMAQPKPSKPTQKALQEMAIKEELKAFYLDPSIAPAEKAWARSRGGQGPARGFCRRFTRHM